VVSASLYETVAAVTVNIGGAVGYSTAFYTYTLRDPARPPATPAIVLGESHSLLLNAKGNVFGFGYNGNGQLGNGSTFSTSVPTAVAGVAGIQQISSSANHALAVRNDGTVKAWGFNDSGQLGVSNTQASAVNAVDVAGVGFVTAVAAGRYHSLALKADGTVWAWGLNSDGQLGDGSLATSRSTPAQIVSLSGVVAIAAGSRHNLALLGNGNVMVWGANESGQLGDGSTTRRTTPVLASIGGVVAVAAGGAHSLAIKSNGTAWAWGANGFGQLGNGGTINSAAPVAIISLGSGVGLIAAGENHSLAVKSGGALFSWGSNLNGQLGDGSSLSRSIPFTMTTPANVVAISGGGHHSAAINNRGELFVWGDNYFGQVGNKSGNFNPAARGANVLQGNSQISTYSQAAGSAIGTASSAGSAVIEIAEIATGYDFHTQPTGTSGVALGKFKNQALTDDITGIDISVSGQGFSRQSTDCAPTLVAGTECNFTIAFTPTGAGTFVGELQVASNLVGSPERRSLFGTGLDPDKPGLKVSATAGETYLSFAPQIVGTASAASNVSITNTGTAPLIISSATVTTGASHFSVTSACATTISAGATCTLPVTFAPAQPTLVNGQLTLTSNAGTQIVTLSGTGVGTTLGPTAPGPPTLQSIVPGDRQLTIHFSAPAYSGGSSVIDYTVTCNPGNFTVTGTTSPVTVTGLTNDTAYTCTLTARNAIGSSSASPTATTTPSTTPALTLASAYSRKSHGGVGPFDVELDLTPQITQAVTVEPRIIGNGHVIVFRFNQPITQPGSATAVDAANANLGTVANVSVLDTDVLVTLTGIPDSQRATVTLRNVNNTGINTAYPVSMGFLVGDVTNSRSVNAGDIGAIKAKIGQSVGLTTYRYDVNTSGIIDAQDVSMVKARAGWVLPKIEGSFPIKPFALSLSKCRKLHSSQE
jgi:alpha-tubulin suppressor-like RCC1 family protein